MLPPSDRSFTHIEGLQDAAAITYNAATARSLSFVSGG